MKIKTKNFTGTRSLTANPRFPTKTNSYRNFSYLSDNKIRHFPSEKKIKEYLLDHPLTNDEFSKTYLVEKTSRFFADKPKTLKGVKEDVGNAIYELKGDAKFLKECPQFKGLLAGVIKNYFTIALQDCLQNKHHVLEKSSIVGTFKKPS